MRFRFKTGLIVVSFLLIGFLATTILTAQWIIGQKAAGQVAENLFKTTAANIEGQVNHLIDLPLKMSGIIAHNTAITAPVDGGLDAPVRHQVFKTLQENSSLYSIYIGKENGSFYQIVATRGDAGVIDKHKAPAGTEWIVRTIFTDASSKRVQSWSFLDAQKNTLSTQIDQQPKYDPRKRPWYEAAMSKDLATLSDVYMFNSLQKPGITASHILGDKSGVVGIDMRLSKLSEYVSNQKLSKNSVVFIYDNKNRVVAVPDKIKNVPFLSDAQKIPSDAVQAVFDKTDEQSDFYTEVRNLMEEGPGFKIGIAAPISDFTDSYRDMQQKIMIIILASLVIIIPLIMYFSQSLALRIKKLAEDAKRIQDKDFSETERSMTRVIELSELEYSFSDMREALFAAEVLYQQQQKEQETKIQRQIKREKDIIDFEKGMVTVFNGLDDADKAMTVTATEMKGIALHTKEQSSTVSISADATSSNVETMASAAEELSASIGEIATQVTQATDSALSAVTKANDTSNKIAILESNVSKISEFVVMINDIAYQTNMLALNATIEAARAGTAGKGFAVVAGEVKTLANQTAQATEEIEKQIQVVQASTTASVDAITTVSDAIEEVNIIATSISAAMEQQSATTSEIARNVEQAASETQNVSDEIKNLQETADRSETASNKIEFAANDLSSQGEVLRNKVKDFLNRVQLDDTEKSNTQ